MESSHTILTTIDGVPCYDRKHDKLVNFAGFQIAESVSGQYGACINVPFSRDARLVALAGICARNAAHVSCGVGAWRAIAVHRTRQLRSVQAGGVALANP
jgi:hypothetical protein